MFCNYLSHVFQNRFSELITLCIVYVLFKKCKKINFFKFELAVLPFAKHSRIALILKIECMKLIFFYLLFNPNLLND